MNSSAADARAVAFLYRWRVKRGSEGQFVQAWTQGTEALKEHCGSYGSRLHLGGDGLWYGYAMWPSIEAREAGYAAGLAPDSYQAMQDAVEELLPEVALNPVVDRLVPLQLEDNMRLLEGIAP